MLAASRLVRRLHARTAAEFAREWEREGTAEQREEDALRRFVRWLAAVPVVDGGSSSTLDDFILTLRAAADSAGSPPAADDDFLADPPPPGLAIDAASACEFLRAAFRVWVTELRPRTPAAGARPKRVLWSDGERCVRRGMSPPGRGLHPPSERRHHDGVDSSIPIGRSRSMKSGGRSSSTSASRRSGCCAATRRGRLGRWMGRCLRP